MEIIALHDTCTKHQTMVSMVSEVYDNKPAGCIHVQANQVP